MSHGDRNATKIATNANNTMEIRISTSNATGMLIMASSVAEITITVASPNKCLPVLATP